MNNYNTNKKYFETNLIKKENKCESEIMPNIQNILITQCYEDILYIGCEAISTTKSTICKHCNQEIKRFKQYKITYPTYAKYNNKNIILKLKSKQYYCEHCNKTTTEQLIDKKEKAQKTKSFIQSMIDTLKETVSYSMVARTYKVSVSNVIRHFDENTKNKNMIKGVEKQEIKNLSIDELRFIKSKESSYQCIIVESNTNQIIDILETRKQEQVKDYLKENYKNIETLSQDLWLPYKIAGKSLNNQIQIIPDRFHVVRQFTWSFTRDRIKLQKQEGIKTNKNWKILTKRESKLDKKGKKKLEEVLEKYPKIKILHKAKEMAYETFKKQEIGEYKKKLEELKNYVKENELQEFEKALKTIENWEEDIENMFKYDYTNGAVERINRTIKQSKNIAFGFKNLERATKLMQYRVNKCTINVA